MVSKSNNYLIIGKNSVLESLENKLPIRKLYLAKSPSFFVDDSIEIHIKPMNELDKLTTENHQGYIAEIPEITFFNLETIFLDKPKRVVILDHIQDVHNFGAILRSINAAGIKHVIIPKDRAATVTSAVLKVSSGGFVGVKIIRVNSIVDAIINLKKGGFWIYATSLKNSSPLQDTRFNTPLALVVGNESKGVSPAVQKHSDVNFYIPMHGTVQSLNVSVATGIALFEIIKNEE